MPAKKNLRILIRLDLLKPQSNPEKIPTILLRWLLSTGRYILILVEAVVLIAFVFRFKLDADIAEIKEEIEVNQLPYIKNLQPFEILIRQTQLKLSSINGFLQSNPDYALILKKIADQMPVSVSLRSLSLEKSLDKISIQINGQAQNNNDLAAFQANLKQDSFFSGVSLSSVGLEEGVIRFTIKANASVAGGGQNL
ncbi:PilN domain-containing protein [Candidatus Daviesbacteria bacterium]|nr:PilN domain-containing protein [Candidatus Daviesbacteria bacterium]